MAGISGFLTSISEHSDYKEGSESINIITEVDENFHLPEEFESDMTHTVGRTEYKSTRSPKKYGVGALFNEEMNRTYIDSAFKIAQDSVDRFKIRIKTMSNKSERKFRITEKDLYEFNAYIKGRSDSDPRLMQYFKSPREYEDYMVEYQQSHLDITNDPAIIGNEKTFSTPTEKVLIVETTNPDKLAEIIQAIKDHGNPGHSFDIIMDEESKEEFNWDGDGSDSIGEIKIEDNKFFSTRQFDAIPKDHPDQELGDNSFIVVKVSPTTGEYFYYDIVSEVHPWWDLVYKTHVDQNVPRLVDKKFVVTKCTKEVTLDKATDYIQKMAKKLGLKEYSSSEKDWWVVAMAEYEDGDKEVRSAYQPQEHKPTKEEAQGFEGRGVELHLFKAFDDERAADEYAAELRGRLQKERELSRSYSEGACPDSGCIQKKPNGSWGVISNKTGEFWEQDYESEDKAKDALAAYHASKHFNDTEGAQIKVFSYGFNPDSAEVRGDQIDTMDILIGSVLYSISYTHLFHLTTQDYPAHIALNEYYEDMPDLVDALAEGWLATHKDVYFQNAVLPTECPIDYLGRLKDYITTIQSEHQYSSAVNSQIDAIVELIDSTLYKLKRLSSHQALFSEFNTEDGELTITTDEGRKRTAREGEEPVEFIQRIKDEKLEALKSQEVDAYDATFSKLSKFSDATRRYFVRK